MICNQVRRLASLGIESVFQAFDIHINPSTNKLLPTSTVVVVLASGASRDSRCSVVIFLTNECDVTCAFSFVFVAATVVSL